MKSKGLKVAGRKIAEAWKRNRYLWRPFLVLFLIYLVGFSAILLASVHYADDVARTNYGYAGWSGFSRYTDTILAHVVHADNYLTNIAPLPQLMAVAEMALASLMLVCVVGGREVFLEKWTKWIWRVVAVTPLGFCPYMLECMSYQYDAPYMALSVLAAVAPLCLRRQRPLVYGVALAVGTLVACTTYQVSLSIVPMLVGFVAVKEWNEDVVEKGARERRAHYVKIAKYVAGSAAVFLVTLLVFQKVLMRPADMYVSNEVVEIGELVPTAVAHLVKYLGLLVSDFRTLWLVLMAMIVVGFVVAFAVRSERNKVVSAVVGALTAVVLVVLAYILYAVLSKPLYTTRAMYAIGAVLAIMGVYIASGRGWQKIMMVPVVMLGWCFFSFAFTYGNALAEQDAYRRMQTEMVIADLNEMLPEFGEVKTLQATGEMGLAPVVAHMPAGDYVILRRLLKPSFGGDVPWMALRLVEGSGLPGAKYDPKMNLEGQDLPELKDTVFYTIYGDERGILVEFKGEKFGGED